MLDMLIKAAGVALSTDDNDHRHFLLGCVGIREDGALVASRNGATKFSSVVEHYQLLPNSHAEGRVLRKLGKNGTLYVARVTRKDGTMAMSLPCAMCQVRIKAARVSKVFYSINRAQYGIWFVKKDYHKICDLPKV